MISILPNYLQFVIFLYLKKCFKERQDFDREDSLTFIKAKEYFEEVFFFNYYRLLHLLESNSLLEFIDQYSFLL